MSSREVQELIKSGGHVVDGQRECIGRGPHLSSGGLGRRRSVSFSTPDLERFSSTAAGQVSPPNNEISLINKHGSLEDMSYRDTSSEFNETPIGAGSGTSSVIGRNQRTSEDEFIHLDTVNNRFEDLIDKVDKYSVDLINHTDWKSLIDSEYNEIEGRLKDFIGKVALTGHAEYVQKATKVKTQLINYKVAWWKRVRDEESNPVITRTNLSQTLDRMNQVDESESTITDVDDVVFTQDVQAEQGQVNRELQQIPENIPLSTAESSGLLQNPVLSISALLQNVSFPPDIQEFINSEANANALKEFDAKLALIAQGVNSCVSKTDELANQIQKCDEAIIRVTGAQGKIWTYCTQTEAKIVSLTKDTNHAKAVQKDLDERLSDLEKSERKQNVRKELDSFKAMVDKNSETIHDLKIKVEKSTAMSDANQQMIDGLRITVRGNKKDVSSLSEALKASTCSPQYSSTRLVGEPSSSQQQVDDLQQSNIQQNTNMVTNRVYEDPQQIKLNEHLLNDLIKKIENRTSVPIDSSSSELLIKECKISSIPAIEKITTSCYQTLQQYIKFSSKDQALCTKVTDTIEQANTWIQKVSECYNQMDLYSMNTSKSSMAELEVFTGEGKQNIYEFVEDFESMYRGRLSDKQKAEKMHRTYLSEPIKNLSEAFSSDYKLLKEYLLEEYGDYDTICDLNIGSLEKVKRPKTSEFRERSELFVKIKAVLQKLEKLKERPEINTIQLKTHIHSKMFMTRILKVMLPEDEVQFSLTLSRLGIDSKKMCGPHTYSELINFSQEMISALTRGALRSEDTAGSSRNTTGDRSVRSSHFMSSPGESVEVVETNHVAHSRGSESPKVSRSPPRWYNRKHIMPCPMDNHNHELGTCAEFFSNTPLERRKASSGRMCWTCLGPRDKCSIRKKGLIKGYVCANETRVKRLLCKDCVAGATQDSERSACNVLMCVNTRHTKPSFQDIEVSLKDWVPGIDVQSVSKVVVMGACSAYGTHAISTCKCGNASCHCLKSSKTRAVHGKQKSVVVDTSTGSAVLPKDGDVIEETAESSFYIMQWLRIGESDCLCFFDSGANIHLVDGVLAENEGLEVVTGKSTTLSVVGGGTIDTQYGTYKLAIGPNADGKFHEIKCQGMSPVASEFNTYPLDEINAEVRTHSKLVGKTEHLPLTIGGPTVHLLIGLKDPAMHPTLIEKLPNGLGIYRSPFKDKFGSRICYGGPHSVFSKINEKAPTASNHAVMLVQTLMSSTDDDHIQGIENALSKVYTVCPPPFNSHEVKCGIQHHMEVDVETGIVIEPSPLNEEEFRLAGCTSIPDTANMLGQIHLKGQGYSPATETCTVQYVHHCGAYKASIPISKMRQLVDQEDVGDLVTYRCPLCSKCVRCKESGKIRAVTMQEALEQAVVDNSVFVDKEKRRVYVKLPFMVDPVEYLTEKHKGKDNYRSARQVYNQVCNKKDFNKDAMREVHKDLVDKGFMVPLESLGEEIQAKINASPFKHYYAWRTTAKEESISTSLRMVVDPTMTGLNSILPKGENNLGNMYEILVRLRTKTHAWSTDISKMYNRLFLMEDDYCFSLFLYDDALDANSDPKVWVMLVAWYGVVPTGNQAGVGIVRIADDAGPEFALAVPSLKDDRFVDDVGSGTMSSDSREEQIKQCRELLGRGGFSLKFVAKSGEKPCDKASSDGQTIRLLGYKWKTFEDELSLAFSEVNFNRKVRGAKKPNEVPVETKNDLSKLLSKVSLTRKLVASKVAEIYDPLGIWEPLKLHLKLELSELNSLGWNQPLRSDDQEKWKDLLLHFADIPTLSVKRCVVPEGGLIDKGVRLLCVSDAATHAGGAAIYVGYELPGGNFSCSLLTSKSKLMSGTVPRNELSAVMLMTEMAYIVKKALKGQVTEVLYLTDSTIALSWCHNTNKRLKLYVHNRVETIRRMIEWTTGISTDLPLYHIEGCTNIADRITKKHDLSIQDINECSPWQSGYDWMRYPTEKMPLKKYSDLVLEGHLVSEAKAECFQDPYSMQVSPRLDDSEEIIEDVFTLIDEGVIGSECGLYSLHSKDTNMESQKVTAPNASSGSTFSNATGIVGQGWIKGVRGLAGSLFYVKKITHNVRIKRSSCLPSCLFCNKQLSFTDIKAELLKESEMVLFREESKVILDSYHKDKLKKFVVKDDVVYFSGRLQEENPFVEKDLDLDAFFDNKEFTGLVPVVRSSSPLFFSYVLFVHTLLRPHAGVEVTLREVMNKMYVMESPRYVIRKVRADCSKCKMILKKTIELEMSKHHFSRTTLAPPFYNCQMDIVYGFVGQPYKNSNKTFKIYALVIVCLLTSATNILVLEGMETQDVVTALERHSSHYGVPMEVFVDNGSQLVALQSVTFQLRDVDAYLYDATGMRVSVSTAKAHEERGRVESKVKAIRSFLERSGVKSGLPMTTIQWETMFAKAANALDDLPIAKGNSSNVSDLGFDVLSPNRLKLGRNNFRSLQGSMDIKAGHLPSALLTRNRKITSTFIQLLLDRAHHFQLKPNKWTESSERGAQVDDIVIFVHTDAGKGSDTDTAWKLGKVTAVSESKVTVMYAAKAKKDKIPKMKMVVRSPRDVSILFSEKELLVNSSDYFTQILEKKKNKCHE